MTRPTPPLEVASRLDRVRALCMAMPEAFEKLAWGEATFRAGEKGKMFATFATYHHDDRVSAWLKAADGAQAILVASNPARFFVPPYQGPCRLGRRLRRCRRTRLGRTRHPHRRRLPPRRPKETPHHPRSPANLTTAGSGSGRLSPLTCHL